MTDFSYEKKVKLRDKIQRHVKSRDDLIHIKSLIKTHNPALSVTKNNNGYFIDILDLTTTTYVEIAKFLDKLDKKRNDESENERSISEAQKNNDKTDECPETVPQKKLKYKNSENHILNRVKYEKALKQHQTESSGETDVVQERAKSEKRLGYPGRIQFPGRRRIH